MNNMSRKPLSILKSGAGIAGSSLALMIARHPSFTLEPVVTLIERSPKPRITGQAIDIRGPAVNVIRQLGLEEKIKERHTTETGIGIVNGKGKTIARFDATGDSKNQSFTTSEYEILRGDLAQVLLEELDATKKTEGTNVEVIYGESIESLEDRNDGVTVDFAKGRLQTRVFDVVVAADGLGSSTRSMMFNQYKTGDCIKPVGWYMAYYTVPRLNHDESVWSWYNAPGGLAVHMRPHRGGKTMGVYLSIVNSRKERIPDLEKVLSEDMDAQRAALRKRFKDVGWQIERFLHGMDHAEDFYMQHVTQVVTPHWTRGQYALIGDSAHATMGVGTSLAMIGAYVMAGELAKAKSSHLEDVSTALGRYESIFRPLVTEHETPPPGFPQLVNPQTKLGLGVLHTAVRLVYWTKLDKLLQGWGQTSEEKWKLPDYGYRPTAAAR